MYQVHKIPRKLPSADQTQLVFEGPDFPEAIQKYEELSGKNPERTEWTYCLQLQHNVLAAGFADVKSGPENLSGRDITGSNR